MSEKRHVLSKCGSGALKIVWLFYYKINQNICFISLRLSSHTLIKILIDVKTTYVELKRKHYLTCLFK